MTTKALVLLSGGQDSTTTLYWAKTMFDSVEVVSINYGQRHATELEAADKIARLAGVSREVLDMPVLSAIGGSALTTKTELRASGGYVDSAMPEGLPTSFVPGRNLLFLTLAGALAVKRGIKDIVTGVCQTDYSGYPDCRRDFIDDMERTLGAAMPSSSGPFRIHTPLMYLTKAETVRLARRLVGCWDALAYSLTCYEGMKPGCGQCPSCELRTRGFVEAGEIDPACPRV